MKNLVNWVKPTAPYSWFESFEGWADSGEGGLYAWAVVRETPENEPSSRADGGCNVDVWARLNHPDVMVDGPDLWKGFADYTEYSEPLLAAVFLGATSDSLVNGNAEYFRVTEDDLTDEGKALVKALSVLGKVDILTFLDT